MPHIANSRSTHPRLCGALRHQFHTLCRQNQSAGKATFSEKVIWKEQKAFPSERRFTPLALAFPLLPPFFRTDNAVKEHPSPRSKYKGVSFGSDVGAEPQLPEAGGHPGVRAGAGQGRGSRSAVAAAEMSFPRAARRLPGGTKLCL